MIPSVSIFKCTFLVSRRYIKIRISIIQNKFSFKCTFSKFKIIIVFENICGSPPFIEKENFYLDLSVHPSVWFLFYSILYMRIVLTCKRTNEIGKKHILGISMNPCLYMSPYLCKGKKKAKVKAQGH